MQLIDNLWYQTARAGDCRLSSIATVRLRWISINEGRGLASYPGPLIEAWVRG